MKKVFRILTVVFSAILVVSLCVGAFAYSDRLNDEAKLLSEDEKVQLSSFLDELSEQCGVEILVAVFDDMSRDGYYDIQAFADDYVDNGDFGPDTVALVMSMADRDYWITTSGVCLEYITDAGIQRIEERILPYLKSGEYYNAFASFAAESSSLISSGANGDIYDIWIEGDGDGNGEYEPVIPEVEKSFPAGRSSVISAILGVVSAFLGTSPMKSDLKSVGIQSGARNYAISDSLNLADHNDVFLYSNVSAVPKPKDTGPKGGSGSSGGHFGGTSIHVSGGGVSHGGGGGKF